MSMNRALRTVAGFVDVNRGTTAVLRVRKRVASRYVETIIVELHDHVVF